MCNFVNTTKKPDIFGSFVYIFNSLFSYSWNFGESLFILFLPTPKHSLILVDIFVLNNKVTEMAHGEWGHGKKIYA